MRRSSRYPSKGIDLDALKNKLNVDKNIAEIRCIAVVAAINTHGQVVAIYMQDTSINIQALIVFLRKLLLIHLGQSFTIYLDNLNVQNNKGVKEICEHNNY